METFFVLFETVLLFAALLLPGYVLGRSNSIEEGGLRSFGNVLVSVAMPFLVFSKLSEMELADIAWSGILISALMPLAVDAILLLVLRRRGKNTPHRRTAVFCALFPNCGFLGIPLAAAVWPEAREMVLYISVFNVTSTFLMLTVGAFILSEDRKKCSLKETLFGPVFFAILLGLLAAATDLVDIFPAVATYSSALAQLATPMSMLVLGFELSKLHPLKLWKDAGIYSVSFVKLFLSPTIALVLLFGLTKLCGDVVAPNVSLAIFVATAVSTAAGAPSMAEKYDADAAYAAALTVTDTLLCVGTLPLMYLLYGLLFGFGMQ